MGKQAGRKGGGFPGDTVFSGSSKRIFGGGFESQKTERKGTIPKNGRERVVVWDKAKLGGVGEREEGADFDALERGKRSGGGV